MSIGAVEKNKKIINNERKLLGKIKPYLFIAPVFICLIAFQGWPLITALIKSFYEYDGMITNKFVGLKNYKDIIFNDRRVWIALKNQLVLFAFMHVSLFTQIAVTKMVHSVVHKKLQYAIRLMFTIPMVVPMTVNLMLWKFIYYPEIGVISRVCDFFGINAPNILGNPSTALVGVVMIGFPWIAGMNFLILFAALQRVDGSTVEAAKLDGANGLRIFWNIELPEMMPQIKTLYILAFIGMFQDYQRFLILTQGGPDNATLVPGLIVYNSAFPSSGTAEFGYACAGSVLLLIITIVLSKVLLREKKDV